MSFYERYENLCTERGMKPQNPEMQRICGVTSGSIFWMEKRFFP